MQVYARAPLSDFALQATIAGARSQVPTDLLLPTYSPTYTPIFPNSYEPTLRQSTQHAMAHVRGSPHTFASSRAAGECAALTCVW